MPEAKEYANSDTQVLDGLGMSNLKAGAVACETLQGDQVLAATWDGRLAENHDRVALVPEKSMFAVMDGMRSVVAAQAIAEALMHVTDVPAAVRYAQSDMRRQQIDGGTCLMAAQILASEGGKELQIFQAGDSKLLVIGANGELRFETQEEANDERHPRGASPSVA